MLFHKYVLGLGWRVVCLPGGGAAAEPAAPGGGGATFEPALAFLDSLAAQLEVRAGPAHRVGLGQAGGARRACA